MWLTGRRYESQPQIPDCTESRTACILLRYPCYELPLHSQHKIIIALFKRVSQLTVEVA